MNRTAPTVVAREAQLARLQALLEQALVGRGQVCFVAGEPGAGKTTLVAEFTRHAQNQHPELVVAVADCNAQTGTGDPYLPFREILALLTGDVDSDLGQGNVTEENASRLQRFLRISGQALVDSGPDLIGLFVPGGSLLAHMAARLSAGNPLTQRVEALLADKARSPESGSASPKQSQILEQYTSVLRTSAAQQPLVLVVDDLQWADAASLDLFFHLGRRIEGSRILLIGTYRPNDLVVGRAGERHPLKPVLAELKRYYGDVLVDLDQTDEADRRRLVEQMIDLEPNRFDDAFREALFRHTEGHPLFASELLRDLRERGAIIRDDEGKWAQAEELSWEALPARVEGVIEERINRLDDELRSALTIGSIEGEEFTAEVVARVLDVEERELVRRLGGELDKQHRLIAAQGARRIGQQRLSVYRFHHSLFQRYLYGRLDEVERSYLHEDVGRVLEAVYGDAVDEIVVPLARHFMEAGDAERAADYLLRAGSRALRLSANQEAIEHFMLGLRLLTSLPDTPARARQELTLQAALSAPLIATRGFASPEVARVYERAGELCRQMEATEQPFPVLFGLVTYHLIRGQVRNALALAETLAERAGELGDPSLIPTAYIPIGYTLMYTGNLAAARTWMGEAVALHQPAHRGMHASMSVHDPSVGGPRGLALVSWLQGDSAEAERWMETALSTAAESSPYNLAGALGFASVLHHFRRDPAAVREQSDALIALSAAHGFPFWLTWGRIVRGWCMIEGAPPDDPMALAEGVQAIRDSLDQWRTAGTELWRPYFLSLLSDALGRQQRTEEAISVVAQAISIAEQTGEHFWEAELYRIRGELAISAGADAEAERTFEQALRIAREQGARSLELRSVTSLARLLVGRGEVGRAAAMLDGILAHFAEGLDNPDLREARALRQQWN